jgi:Rrf2 family iron-sulfur cluster assembly transcriptional regulator
VRVTSKSRYALAALVELDLRTGGEGRPVRLADLARAGGIPEQYLEQLFAGLRRAGFLDGHRGAGGGFTFARRPDQLTVLDVVEALDGRHGIGVCAPAECAHEERNGSAAVWRAAGAAFEGVLAGATISDLAERERQLRSGMPMYEV